MYCILEFGKLCRHLAQPKRLEGFPRRNESSMNEVQEKKNSKQTKAGRAFLAEKNSWSKNTDGQTGARQEGPSER